MKKQTPEKAYVHLTKPTETLIARVKHDTGIFIALVESTSFQLQKFLPFVAGADKVQLYNLKGHLDGVIRKHRAAEKKANPAGYDKYDLAFDQSAETIIDLLGALQKGEIKVEQYTETKAA